MAVLPIINSIAINRVLTPHAALLTRPVTGRMRIAPDNGSGTVINVPWAPSAVDHGNFAADFVTINKPSIAPSIVLNAPPLVTMGCTLYVADKKVIHHSTNTRKLQSYSVAITAISTLNVLKGYASSGTRVRVTYGALESGLWYITSMTISSLVRDPNTNEITQANVALTFTKAGDSRQSTGPTSGGVKPPTPTPAPRPPTKTTAKTYVVKKGDTLWGISIKFYGTGTKWTKIADANGIKNPKALQVGKTLRIP